MKLQVSSAPIDWNVDILPEPDDFLELREFGRILHLWQLQRRPIRITIMPLRPTQVASLCGIGRQPLLPSLKVSLVSPLLLRPLPDSIFVAGG